MQASLLLLLFSFMIPALCFPIPVGKDDEVLLRLRPRNNNGDDNVGGLASSLLSSAGLAAFLGSNDNIITQNQVVKNGSACADMTVLFARGTGELGNVGTLTGPPFFAAVASSLNGTDQLAVQGVDYDASVAGFLKGGSPRGATTMAGLVNQSLAACPSTTLILSGYSQGAQLVHLAMASLPTNVTSKVSSIVLFGDPKNGTAINGIDASKVMTICHTGDDICSGGDVIRLQHLTYGFGNNGSDVEMGASFALGSMAEKGITSTTMSQIAVGDRIIG